ncbi:aminotransferase class IV family protein [Streptomyces sp. NPDC058092]|uniref:aminotransferase class IV family protein n=1 Tax=Streptomyces sp. NPDC058092 TaxID=3346336 RepID=UPI0036E0089F
MAELNGAPVSFEALQNLALTNYGHFTSMRVEDQKVRGLSLHLDRLVRDARTVFDADLDPDRIQAYIRHAVGERTGSFVTRVTVFDPDLDLGHPAAAGRPQILVTARAAAALPAPALTVKTFPFSRDTPQVKHLALFSQLKLRRAAQLAGFDDAAFTEHDGRISEGGTWNMAFITEEDTVVWPEADVLPGVTMHLLRQAYDRTAHAPVTLDDLPAMRAAFSTNTSVGVRAITTVDDTPFDTRHPVLDTLRKLYAAVPGEQL